MSEVVLKGRGLAPGCAVGCAVCLDTSAAEIYRIPLPISGVEEEVDRFREALDRARREVKETLREATALVDAELGAIFQAHALMLEDAALLGRIERWIRERKVNAEWAVHRTEQNLIARFEVLDAPHLRERAEDVRDVSRSLLRALQGTRHHQLSEIGGDLVIIAHDLTPSDAVRLGREGAAAFALESGGPTSHTAIIARSLHIPLVAGLEGLGEQALDDAPVLVDGDLGEVVFHPSAEHLEAYRERRGALAREEQRLAATRELEAITLDGVEVELLANVDLPEEIEEAVRFGAGGVGLYRSEFLFIEKSPALPSEEEQLDVLRRMLRALHPRQVIVRTFDLGGRKLAQEVMETHESNPVLGLRGIRLTLARAEVFRPQLRALLRAAALEGNLRVMLPMVTTVEEIRQFRDLLSAAGEELRSEGVPHSLEVPVGAMIEVPAAALTADRLAREADFLSIGTNDLIQYALAVDRGNEHVAYLYQPAHPAVLRMVAFVVESGRAAGIQVSMCGEMAADPEFTALLLGLGLRCFSVAPRRLPEVKGRIRSLRLDGLEELAERCRQAVTVAEVEEILAGHSPERHISR